MPDGHPPDIDDLSIPDDELLYIRVFPDEDSVAHDTSRNRLRPTTGALKSRDQPLSVDLSSLCNPEQTRDRDKSQAYHVAAFTAGTARRNGCRIARDPLNATPTSPSNLAHAVVFGNHENGSGGLIAKSQSRRIAHEAWIVLLNENATWPHRTS